MSPCDAGSLLAPWLSSSRARAGRSSRAQWTWSREGPSTPRCGTVRKGARGLDLCFGGRIHFLETIVVSWYLYCYPPPPLPQVIYGDTDSVMIHTGTDDVREARDLGARIKREVRTGVWLRGKDVDRWRNGLILRSGQIRQPHLAAITEDFIASILPLPPYKPNIAHVSGEQAVPPAGD